MLLFPALKRDERLVRFEIQRESKLWDLLFCLADLASLAPSCISREEAQRYGKGRVYYEVLSSAHLSFRALSEVASGKL